MIRKLWPTDRRPNFLDVIHKEIGEEKGSLCRPNPSYIIGLPLLAAVAPGVGVGVGWGWAWVCGGGGGGGVAGLSHASVLSCALVTND